MYLLKDPIIEYYYNMLLFGANGTLARSKIVPVCNKLNVQVTHISRSPPKRIDQRDNWVGYDDSPFPSTDIAYFADINYDALYLLYDLHGDTLAFLEKPVGHNKKTFMSFARAIQHAPVDIVYVDHYLHKYIPDLQKFDINVADITNITVKLHESETHHDLFDFAGIIRDVLQNHILMALSTCIAQATNSTALDVLNAFEPLEDSRRMIFYRGDNVV